MTKTNMVEALVANLAAMALALLVNAVAPGVCTSVAGIFAIPIVYAKFADKVNGKLIAIVSQVFSGLGITIITLANGREIGLAATLFFAVWEYIVFIKYHSKLSS